MNKEAFNYKMGYTHGGIPFHADDVFSTALCKLICIKRGESFAVLRGFFPENFSSEDDILIYDIGNGKYDHHKERELRESNQIPYAAFGKLWRDFGWILCKGHDDVWQYIDDNFVSSIDAVDNGVPGAKNEFSTHIHNMNPTWDDEDNNVDRAFDKAVNFAIEVLSLAIDRAISASRAKLAVEDALHRMTYNKVVVLDKYMPWNTVLIPSDAEFVIYPSSRGGYSLQVVPKDFNTTEAKHPVPGKYWGSKDLYEIEGCTFCHNTGFLMAFDTVEHAINFVTQFTKVKADWMEEE